MTDELYYTRLRFSGRHGIAKMHGTVLALDVGPDLGSGPVWFVDYRPECGFALVQPRSIEPVREMFDSERRAADALLRSVTTMPEVER
ncbi:MAG: hypothetical protein MUF16_10525 [Burkholderiaceae bacterium]|jgi:hypothetical protein|nr:hypothetical protein [Burkholderiaceae bacterium]